MIRNRFSKMFQLRLPWIGDEVLLKSIDWFENFPWNQEIAVKTEGDQYEYCLHLKDFEPKDISVHVNDGFIVVKAKHEEKKDEYGYITRSFSRRYRLPEDCSLEDIVSKLSSDGVLTITVAKRPVIKSDVIPVTHENKVKSKL